jgi:hypothetical protein
MRRSRLRVSFHIPRHTWQYAGDPPSAANVKRKRGNTPASDHLSVRPLGVADGTFFVLPRNRVCGGKML